MNRHALFLLALVVPAATLAAPAYLQCSIDADGEKKVFSVKVDEASGKITHTRANGSAFNADGFFSANKISYQQIEPGELVVTFAYEIDRGSLAVTETFRIEAADPRYAAKMKPSVSTHTGTCKIEQIKKRKI